MDVTLNFTTPTDVSALATAAKQDAQTTAIGLTARETGGNLAAILAKIVSGAALDATVQAVRDRLPASLVGGRVDVNVGASTTLTTAGTSTVTQGTAGASPWPVSLAAGSNVVGHVIADSGSTTAVTALPAIPTGSNTIGAVTGTSAAELAHDRTTAAAPSAVRVSDGTSFVAVATAALQSTISATLTAIQALLPTSLGQKLSAASLGVVMANAQVSKGATFAAVGVALKSGIGTVIYTQFENASGAAVFFQVHDGTAQPSAAARPVWYGSSVANNAVTSTTVGASIYGAPCQTGTYGVFSSTQFTYTAIASSAIACTIYHL